MKCKLLLILFILSHIINLTCAANILVVLAVPYYSHHLVAHNVLTKLLDHGHNLTIITARPMQYMPNHKVFQHELRGSGGAVYFKYSNILHYKTKKLNPFQIYGSFKIKGNYELAKIQMYDEYFLHLIHNAKNYKFDLLIMECEFCPFIVLAEIFDVPIVILSGGEPVNYQHELIKNHVHAFIADVYTTFEIHENVPFFYRIRSYCMNLLNDFFGFSLKKLNDALVQKLLPDLKFPKFEDILVPRMKLYFSFTSTLTTPIRPTVPYYHQIGYIHLKLPNEMNEDMEVKQFLDKSVDGAVIVSFGSLASDFSDEQFMKFVEVFRKLPFNFIWKANPERYEHLNIPKNVLMLKWLPISDMLAHSNVKLLIAHAGLRTIEEAIDRQIPMVLIGLSYDQPFNAKLMDKHGIAKALDLNDFTDAELTGTIKEMMKEKYKQNIRKMRELMCDKMTKSIDVAVNEIELLVEHNETYGYLSYGDHDVAYIDKGSFPIHLIIAALAAIVLYSTWK